jgi:hypothetical protein
VSEIAISVGYFLFGFCASSAAIFEELGYSGFSSTSGGACVCVLVLVTTTLVLKHTYGFDPSKERCFFSLNETFVVTCYYTVNESTYYQVLTMFM